MFPTSAPDAAAWSPGRPAYLCDHAPAPFLSIRALAPVELMLQRICARDGLTFWGEAAAALLDAEIRKAPPRAPIMPSKLFGSAVGRRAVGVVAPAQRFACFPSDRTLHALRGIGGRWGRSPEAVAAMLLHRAALRFWVMQ